MVWVSLLGPPFVLRTFPPSTGETLVLSGISPFNEGESGDLWFGGISW